MIMKQQLSMATTDAGLYPHQHMTGATSLAPSGGGPSASTGAPTHVTGGPSAPAGGGIGVGGGMASSAAPGAPQGISLGTPSLEPDYFSIGMCVELTVMPRKVLRGEVVAFDFPLKMLSIKSLASNGRQGLSDVQIVNLEFVSDIQVISETPVDHLPTPLPNLNFPKLAARTQASVGEKLRKIGYEGGQEVSPTAQKLVNTITKTIAEVRWIGLDIVVLDQVTISPPYDAASCRLTQQGTEQALQHVQKLVGKFIKENSDGASSQNPAQM